MPCISTAFRENSGALELNRISLFDATKVASELHTTCRARVNPAPRPECICERKRACAAVLDRSSRDKKPPIKCTCAATTHGTSAPSSRRRRRFLVIIPAGRAQIQLPAPSVPASAGARVPPFLAGRAGTRSHPSSAPAQPQHTARTLQSPSSPSGAVPRIPAGRAQTQLPAPSVPASAGARMPPFFAGRAGTTSRPSSAPAATTHACLYAAPECGN